MKYENDLMLFIIVVTLFILAALDTITKTVSCW